MRPYRAVLTSLAVLTLLGTGVTHARAQDAATPPVPTARSLWYDAGALLGDRIRFGAEALPFGRFTAGFAVEYTHTMHPRDELLYPPCAYCGVAVPNYCDPRSLMLCTYPYGVYGVPEHYRAWAFDLTVRYYPAALSFRNGGARMGVYAGASLGYRWRTWEEQSTGWYCPPGYACPLANVPASGGPVVSPADSVPLYPQYPTMGYVVPVRHTLKGIEPGLEIGVRLQPFGPLFLEVGGRFTLVVIDDKLQRPAPGDVDARLVLGGGIAW